MRLATRRVLQSLASRLQQSWESSLQPVFCGREQARIEPPAPSRRAIAFFKVGWDKPALRRWPTMYARDPGVVGLRGEAPLVPPYVLSSL